MKKLDITEKQNIQYCISHELRDEQIKINITKVKERFVPTKDLINEPIAIVCFAPSLKETWHELKKFKYIMTCSGAHKFLLEKGIVPTWHVDLEPREHKVKLLGPPHKDVQYLIASTIHPNYLDALKGYNTKLWHIFANDEEAERVLPKGEFKITGGSSVGLRCMTLSRLLGFTDLHIFGMDGNVRPDATHTFKHPNPPPTDGFSTEYNGKEYFTTPSILFCAKETFHELDQMSDVKATFYGEGLCQDMAKDYIPAPKKQTNIAFVSPILISEEHKNLNYKLHQSNPSYGMGGSKYRDTVLRLMKETKTTSVLDYGCGKGMLAKSLDVPIWEYDPAIPEKSGIPKPADIVICTDVLEHIEHDKLNFVLDDLKRCVKQIGYFVISTRKAVKTYENGKNAHSIVQGEEWWKKKLEKFFSIGTIINKEKECELHAVVAPKKAPQQDIAIAEIDGLKFKYLVPNETTKWRAKTLFTKEPSTIEWINSMKKGDILFDVGANVGSYSVYAGVKGIKVFAFEPEAENYAMLVKNLQLNNIEPNAYCIALSYKMEIGTLFASGGEMGGACHSFNQKVGHDLKARETPFTQGCIGLTLDDLHNNGLPIPNHIKIDVDGLEHAVVNGGRFILNYVESILVEVNPSLPQHIQMLEYLKGYGFEFDKDQVERATRKEGTFKGCAEYVFRKKVEKLDNNGNLFAHTINQIKNAKVFSQPFPHIFIENVFEPSLYNELISNFPDNYTEIEKTRGTRGYPKRFTTDTNSGIWHQISEVMKFGEFKKAICEKFKLPDDQQYTEDVLLIRDKPGYQITPHTDTPHKVISALFYFPKDESDFSAGTNMYTPNKKGFMCSDGKHYPFDQFKKIKSFPYKPNSVLIFLRTNNSFHGVEPSDVERNVLLYNLRKK